MKEVSKENCGDCKYLQVYGCPCQKPTCRIKVTPGDQGCKRCNQNPLEESDLGS